MSTLTVNAPTTGLIAPSDKWGSRTAIANQMKTGWNKYGNFFKFASQESGIPVKVLVSFATVESGLNPTAGSGATKGLFQFNHAYVKDQLKNEFTSNRLSANEKAKLASFGFTFDANGNTRAFTSADAVKPELNILIGSILISQLADQPWGKLGNELRLDKIITIYNSGIYSKWSKIAMASKSTTPKGLHDELAGNSVTQSYVKKIFGKDGTLDILTSDLKALIA